MARAGAARAATAAPARPRKPRPKAVPAKPRTPRRRSGPAAKPRGAPASRTAPRTRTERAPRQPLTAEALRAALLARGSGLLDKLLRGRLWVVCVGFLLAGIVFLNVGLLQLNDQIARTDRKSGSIGRENAALRLKLAKLDSTERIQSLAEAKGFVMPAPGAVRYVRSRSRDAREAARHTVAPQPPTPPVPAQGTPATPGTTPVGTAPTAAAPVQQAPAAGAQTGQPVPAATAPAATAPTP